MEKILSQSVEMLRLYIVTQNCVPMQVTRLPNCVHIVVTTHVETVVLLSKGIIDSQKVKVEMSLEDMDMSGFEKDATYEAIKDYVKEQTGYKVSSLYIAQVKAKHGLDMRENFNLPKGEDARQPKCPAEKEKAIEDALRHFQMI